VQHNVEVITNVLDHRHVDVLPRGELFIGSDFLDHYFPRRKGESIKQLQEAAESLGLSLVGVELNSEQSRSLLINNACNELQEYFVAGYVNGPVSRLIETHGFKKAMLSTRNDPALFSNIATALTEEIKEKAALARANGFSAIVLADDIAGNNGLLFSLRYFTDAVLPVYSRLAAIIKEAGLYTFIHSDGDMRKVIDLIAGAGYDCIHPVDAQAGLDISALLRESGDKISFMGHIDMLGWDEARVRNEIVIAEKKFRNGGLILGSTGGISMAIPEDKFRALYPLWEPKRT
jgi:uroporphyrinogen-III decarboxylase